jgi:hypothetical protein
MSFASIDPQIFFVVNSCQLRNWEKSTDIPLIFPPDHFFFVQQLNIVYPINQMSHRFKRVSANNPSFLVGTQTQKGIAGLSKGFVTKTTKKKLGATKLNKLQQFGNNKFYKPLEMVSISSTPSVKRSFLDFPESNSATEDEIQEDEQPERPETPHTPPQEEEDKECEEQESNVDLLLQHLEESLNRLEQQQLHRRRDGVPGADDDQT